jgi:hypothetical protein
MFSGESLVEDFSRLMENELTGSHESPYPESLPKQPQF